MFKPFHVAGSDIYHQIYEPRREKICIRCFRPGDTNRATEATEDDQRLAISDLGSRGIVLPYVMKTKALTSCVVTTQLICAFVFANTGKAFS